MKTPSKDKVFNKTIELAEGYFKMLCLELPGFAWFWYELDKNNKDLILDTLKLRMAYLVSYAKGEEP